jgi:hypothetical protein
MTNPGKPRDHASNINEIPRNPKYPEPTPDKTMDDVSRLVSALETAKMFAGQERCAITNQKHTPDCFCVPCCRFRIYDALESVAKERDAAVEALKFYATEQHIQHRGTTIEIVENGLTARAALEKLNAK